MPAKALAMSMHALLSRLSEVLTASGAELLSPSCVLLLPSPLGLSPLAASGAPGSPVSGQAVVDLSPHWQLYQFSCLSCPVSNLEIPRSTTTVLLGLAEALPLVPFPLSLPWGRRDHGGPQGARREESLSGGGPF